METRTEPYPTRRSELWRERWQSLRKKLKSLFPFTAGILAAFLGLLLFNAIHPPQPPMTVNEVNQAVAQAMASATPAPAYSTLVYQFIQPSPVLIQAKNPDQKGEGSISLGSGVVISDQGEVLTALHVVKTPPKLSSPLPMAPSRVPK